MAKFVLFALLLLAGGGIAPGGEERDHMPMRGSDADGALVRYNDFVGERFMEWKNHCDVRPALVEGQELSLTAAPGFFRVAPYLSRSRALFP